MVMRSFFSRKKSLEEIQQENERLRVERENEQLAYSIKQQRAVSSELRKSGLSLKDFGGNIKSALRWLRGRSS